jgi:site-specific DNA-methyltransferase (adenine-specific)
LKLKTIIIWVKDNWSAGDLEGSFGNQYEQILFLSKGRHKIRGKRWSNVWEFPRVPAKQLLHPAQKPTALLRRAIEASSDVGYDVVDPFCGSGSTGVAARECGRGFLMCDMDEKMARSSRVRLGLPVGERVQKQEDVFSYQYNIPNPEDWGIHPEEIRWLYEELKKNKGELNVLQ